MCRPQPGLGKTGGAYEIPVYACYRKDEGKHIVIGKVIIDIRIIESRGAPGCIAPMAGVGDDPRAGVDLTGHHGSRRVSGGIFPTLAAVI